MIFFFHQMYFITLEGVLHKKKKTGRATFPFLSSSSTSFDIKTTTTKNNKTTGRTKNRSSLAFSENHFKNKFF